jgi:hypothetical protein
MYVCKDVKDVIPIRCLHRDDLSGHLHLHLLSSNARLSRKSAAEMVRRVRFAVDP